MKNFYLLLIFCCLFLNCTDDNSEATSTANSTTPLASKPEAKSMFDNSYKGIYKGIVIGNVSGTLHVNILNDEALWAKFQTGDKITYTLESVPLIEESGLSNVPNLKKYRFADENISFDIKLDEYGGNVVVSNFNFYSDKTYGVCLIKEKSTSLIKCYIGVFSGMDESGIINFTTDGQLNVKGLSKKLNAYNITAVNGEINMAFPTDGVSKADNNGNSNMKYKLNANLHIGQISGYLDIYSFDGNWTYEGHELGDWNATRIL